MAHRRRVLDPAGLGAWNLADQRRGRLPSGVCSCAASISGDPVSASARMGRTRRLASVRQWRASSTLNTALRSQRRRHPQHLRGRRRGIVNGARETVKVDNQAPTVSLAVPATALSTAGTQYVTVNVSTGPSGAYGADCSIDGGPQTFYAGAASQVPVSGIGEHTVTCTGLNNAHQLRTASEPARVPRASPSTSNSRRSEAITFSKLATRSSAGRSSSGCRVLGKPHTITLHGHKVQVRRYRTVKRQVRRCKARTVKRRVRVELKRHGKVVRRHGKVVRVQADGASRAAAPPHPSRRFATSSTGTARRCPGVLLLSDGTPLADQTVTVLARAEQRRRAFAPISTAVTSANGFGWRRSRAARRA